MPVIIKNMDVDVEARGADEAAPDEAPQEAEVKKSTPNAQDFEDMIRHLAGRRQRVAAH